MRKSKPTHRPKRPPPTRAFERGDSVAIAYKSPGWTSYSMGIVDEVLKDGSFTVTHENFNWGFSTGWTSGPHHTRYRPDGSSVTLTVWVEHMEPEQNPDREYRAACLARARAEYEDALARGVLVDYRGRPALKHIVERFVD